MRTCLIFFPVGFEDGAHVWHLALLSAHTRFESLGCSNTRALVPLFQNIEALVRFSVDTRAIYFEVFHRSSVH